MNSFIYFSLCTNEYVEKCETRGTGVKYEESIIQAKQLNGIADERMIPIWLDGKVAVPPKLEGKYAIDIKDRSNY